MGAVASLTQAPTQGDPLRGELVLTTSLGEGASEAGAYPPVRTELPCGSYPTLCTAVLKGEELAPVAPMQACTMEFGGYGEATLEGAVQGKAIALSFSKRNGCELERWAQLESLLEADAADMVSVPLLPQE